MTEFTTAQPHERGRPELRTEDDLIRWIAKQSGRPEAEIRKARSSAERRTASGLVEVRATATSTTSDTRITGYATVYNRGYSIAGGPPHGFVETVAPGAADRALREKQDVRLLINHEGLPLARTTSGTLRLSSDAHGLKIEADLDPENPTVQSLRSAMSRGDATQMSFAFSVANGGQRWNADYTERLITNMDLYDVSVVSFPASPHTSVSLAPTGRSGRSIGLARAQAAVRRRPVTRTTNPPTARKGQPTPAQQMRARRYGGTK